MDFQNCVLDLNLNGLISSITPKDVTQCFMPGSKTQYLKNKTGCLEDWEDQCWGRDEELREAQDTWGGIFILFSSIYNINYINHVHDFTQA